MVNGQTDHWIKYNPLHLVQFQTTLQDSHTCDRVSQSISLVLIVVRLTLHFKVIWLHKNFFILLWWTVVWNIEVQLRCNSQAAEAYGSQLLWLLVGLAPVEGVIPAAVLPVGILFCERGGASEWMPFITASIAFLFFSVDCFPKLVGILIMPLQALGMYRPETGLKDVSPL